MKHIRKFLLFLPPVILCGAAVTLSRKPEHSCIPAGTEEERRAYLYHCGLQGEAAGSCTVMIPQKFTGIYADYAALQQQQGLPLAEYAGETAVVYTYQLEKDYAEFLVTDGILAGAHRCSPEGAEILSMEGKPFRSAVTEIQSD